MKRKTKGRMRDIHNKVSGKRETRKRLSIRGKDNKWKEKEKRKEKEKKGKKVRRGKMMMMMRELKTYNKHPFHRLHLCSPDSHHITCLE